MKKLVLLFAALLVAGCGEKSSSEGSESASENPTPSNESAEPSADTAKPSPAETPVAETPIPAQTKLSYGLPIALETLKHRAASRRTSNPLLSPAGERETERGEAEKQRRGRLRNLGHLNVAQAHLKRAPRRRIGRVLNLVA